MAFPIPSHLPRKSTPQDVSSKILSKIDEATNQSLDAQLASSWLAELDETIQLTKERIHERIHSDLPNFERQLSSSKSIQTRLQSLSSNVDSMGDAVSNPESGLIPTLVKALTTHSALAQDAADADVVHESLAHLLRSRSELDMLNSLTQQGKLPDAVRICASLEALLNEAPLPLSQAHIMVELKRAFRVAKDRTEEQLSDAYSRCIVVSPSELIVRPSVQIRQSDSILSLPEILLSLSPASLTSHLTTLRRDLTTYYIDHTLKQPTSITTASGKDNLGEPEQKLSQFPSPPNTEDRNSRIENLSTILTFLNTHLLPALPPSQRNTFPRSLCNPVTSALLQNLLIPSLPSSLAALPPFLELVSHAVEFEENFVVGFLGNSGADREVKAWADGVSGHYERKRRIEILDRARVIIVAREDESRTFQVEVVPESEKEVVAVQADSVGVDTESAGWGFEDDEKATDEDPGNTEENGWGFDDEEPELEPEPEPRPDSEPSHDPESKADEDPADAWGWNDEEGSSPTDDNGEENAWDDPWGEEAAPNPRPPAAPSITSPKPATRLEKFSSKGKASAPPNGDSVPAPSSKVAEKRPANISVQPVPVETYLVSERMRAITSIVEDALREGNEYASSKLFLSSSSAPGTLLLQSALSVLELYRALYPVTFSSDLASSPARSMRFSNDCLYLGLEVARIEKTTSGIASVKDRLGECRDRLEVVGDSWFGDTIEKQRQAVDEILIGTEGFTDTSDQDRFDECENIVSRVLREIRTVARQWKDVIIKSKYYAAVGLVVDAALSRILEDVLALPDIPEVESHRLSELCKILNALEGLFVEDPNEPSFVVAYVPSWLKYSYLSELLEASIADISYLFEEGALVDFEVDELVKLVRALFADTPLRATTVNKLLGGHPNRS